MNCSECGQQKTKGKVCRLPHKGGKSCWVCLDPFCIRSHYGPVFAASRLHFAHSVHHSYDASFPPVEP